MSIDVSIIIPTYNKFPLNLLTLYSLENQTYDSSKFEVILVDDGSTDSTLSIADNYLFPFHFKYIRVPQNIGRPAARNTGIRAAKGRWIIFLDAEILV